MKVLKIKDIVRTISITHKFDKDKLIAINTSDVENGIMHDGTLTAIEDLKGQFKKTVQKGDILFSEIRPANRRFALVTKDDCADYVVSTKLMVLRKYNNEVDLRYFYYCLTNQPFLDMLQRKAENRIGSFPQITFDLLSEYAFPVPSLSEQEKIANIIFSLDHKIELNKQINDNLEAMAKQLYDYWFVQFDFPNEEGKPYKSSGGVMVWNEKLKREIPQGWSISNVKSLIEPIERGISYSSDDLLDPFATPMINLACFSKAGDYRLGEMKFFSGKVSNDKLISPMDMLIACTDMTQGADIIGRPILASDEYNQYTFSTDLALITPKGKFKMYLYYTLRTPFYHKYIRPFASGTTVKHLNLIGIENYGLPVPPIEIQSKFEDLITPIKEKQSKNLNEINALTKQRDELLPLLMNGQASVNYHLSDD